MRKLTSSLFLESDQGACVVERGHFGGTCERDAAAAERGAFPALEPRRPRRLRAVARLDNALRTATSQPVGEHPQRLLFDGARPGHETAADGRRRGPGRHFPRPSRSPSFNRVQGKPYLASATGRGEGERDNEAREKLKAN